MFQIIIQTILLFAIPIATPVFFAVCLYRYLSAKKKKRADPDSVTPEEMRSRKVWLIVSSTVAAVLVAVVIGMVVLVYTAIAFM